MQRVLPILFNTEMVLAILEDRKNVTRRLVRFLPGKNPNWTGYVKDGLMLYNGKNEPCCRKAQYQPGDILYVRETFRPLSNHPGAGFEYVTDWSPEYFENSKDPKACNGGKWKPSIHMPKDAARIWLRVTDVRVERLNSMTLDDFLNEGVVIRPEAFNDPENAYQQAKNAFINIWDSTIKKTDKAIYGWYANPYVLTTEFERCEKPDEE